VAEATAALGHVDAAGLALVGVLAAVHWLRGRGPARAYLALALGLLAVVSVLRQVAPAGHLPAPFALFNLLCFIGSAYALLEVRHQLVPMEARTRRVVIAVLGTTTVLTVPVVLGIAPVRYVTVVALLVIGIWCACIAEPAMRFWTAARDRPAVQRARLRLLSAAYLALAVALILAVLGFAGITAVTRTTTQPPVVALVFQAVATSVIPFFAIGFMPPLWLRRVWRSIETDAYRKAMLDLVMFASDSATMAGRGLDWAMRFLGGDAGVFVMSDGNPLVFRGMDSDAARELARDIRQRDVRRPGMVRTSIAVAPLRVDGQRTWLAVRSGAVSPVFGDDEVHMLALFTNSLALALDRVLLTQRISEQTQRIETVLAAVAELGGGILVAEKEGRIVDVNDAVLHITGFTREELHAMRLVELVPEADRDEPRARFAELLERREPMSFESRMMRKDGGVVDVAAAVSVIVQDGHERIVAMTQDISARKRGEAALSEAARIDPLTGVPNRRAWNERLDYTLAHAARSHEPLCVAMLDLDDFKQFNDDWGHQRGDLLLENAVHLWSGALREGDFLARLGGDEFAVIMPGCSAGQATAVLMRMVGTTPDGVSAGVAQWDGVETGDALVARADAALLHAKRERRGGVVVDSESDATTKSAGLVARIESILDGRFLRSAYQPIVDLERNVVVGHEALLRPSGVAADTSVEDLFAAAQRFGYARDLDWLSRRAALEGAGSLPQDDVLFVNVSSWALLDPVHGSDQMLMLLRWVGRAPEQVVLEISEREVITNRQRLRAVLADYRAHGFRFALDDVGEGHSTLEVLAAAEPEFIKVARSLTEHLDESGPSSAVRAIVTFAECNGADVIAEGISEKRMIGRVRELGVRYGQGFALGVPQFIESRATPALNAS
jgi:diguanylate cyclase (GGDEF)-like protein/PAS domain S-box-containing protein